MKIVKKFLYGLALLTGIMAGPVFCYGAPPYPGGSVTAHGHSSNGDGGVLANPRITGGNPTFGTITASTETLVTLNIGNRVLTSTSTSTSSVIGNKTSNQSLTVSDQQWPNTMRPNYVEFSTTTDTLGEYVVSTFTASANSTVNFAWSMKIGNTNYTSGNAVGSNEHSGYYLYLYKNGVLAQQLNYVTINWPANSNTITGSTTAVLSAGDTIRIAIAAYDYACWYSGCNDLTGSVIIGATANTMTITGTPATATYAYSYNGGIVFPDGGKLNSLAPNNTFLGYGRNRILNGDMRFDTKLESDGVTKLGYSSVGGAAHYGLDQWRYENTGVSTFTVTRTSESVPNLTDDSNFKWAMRVSYTSTEPVTASAVGANMEYPMDPVYQKDWMWGSTYAKPVTLQFWILSSSAGVYSLALLNGVNSQSYVMTYTITSANTWQKFVVTVPGPTTGGSTAWPVDGAVFGLKVVWDLGTSNMAETSTTGSWLTGSYWKVTGTNNLNRAATLHSWYLTGVQLEIGSYATPFEFVDDVVQIRRLQKYRWKSFIAGQPVGTQKGYSGAITYVANTAAGTTGHSEIINYPVEMLATPVLTFYNPTNNNAKWYAQNGATADSGTVGVLQTNANRSVIYNPQTAGDAMASVISVHMFASSVLGGE